MRALLARLARFGRARQTVLLVGKLFSEAQDDAL